MTEIKADVRDFVTYATCKKCGQLNRFGVNKFVPVGRVLPSLCMNCRDHTTHEVIYHVLDVRAFVVAEDGYNIERFLVVDRL